MRALERGHRAARRAGGAACAAVVALIALAIAQPAAAALRAVVEPDPFRMAVVDATGTTVLQEVPGGGLRLRAGGIDFRATKVVSERRDGERYTASVATTDPAGRTLDVTIEPAGAGALRIAAVVAGGSAEQVGTSFAAQAGERYLGFGERSNAVDQRGNAVESYVAEGPYQEIERPFIAAFVPLPGYHPRDDATYFPIPWLLSSAGYGVLVENDEAVDHDLSAADRWSVANRGATLRLAVFEGPAPADALRRVSAHVGRQPPAAAPFFFGPWWQPTNDQQNLETLRKADAPSSVAQTYTHYLPCGDQTGREAAQRERTKRFHDAGLAVTTYFNPMICTSYERVYEAARAANVLTKNSSGQPYEYKYTGSTVFFVGQVDFTAPGAAQFYGGLLAEAVADGYDGWMEDFGEYTPLDAVGADASTGEPLHNRYVDGYHGAAYTYSRAAGHPLARFNRSGWTHTAKSSQIVWGGDPTTSWGFDGLRSALYNGLTMGLSGVSLWGSDIGGFFALSEPQTTPELLVRWLQLGAVSGVMRTQANGFELRPSTRAQIFDDEILPIWRRYAKLRTQLYPYIHAAQEHYDRTGLPIMRHHALTHAGDPKAVARDDQELFGPDLLAAPVMEPGQTERNVHLPEGDDWIDLWRSAAVRADGSLALGAARVLEGGADPTLPAPLAELPLLVRAGAVLPMLPADVFTLTGYGGDAVVNLADRAGRRQLLAWPVTGVWRGALGPGGERMTSLPSRRGWALRIRARRARTYDLQAWLGRLGDLRPCRLRADRKLVSRKRWRYDRRTRVLTAGLRLPRVVTLRVERCRASAPARSH